MCRTPQKTGSRSAFTLVEMVVVLLIIAILASLAWSVTVNAIGKVTEAQTRTEISELETALRAFMADYGLSDPPPSYLVLNEYNPSSTPSAAFLQKLFGKNLGINVDWNGNGVIDGLAPPNGWVLEGEKCLIFYLGGIPNSAAVASGAPPAPQGFSTNNMNPAMPVALSPKRKGPYYPFITSRLWPQPGQIPLSWDGFFVYIDPWQAKTSPFYKTMGGTPYAYFSSQGIYNSGYWANTLVDCKSIGALPYYNANPSGQPIIPPKQPTSQFTNPNTYQIISAGKDGVFGTAGWTPSSGAIGPGADDQANFSSTLLGQGQN